MLVFIVPVKSKKVSGDWESFIKLVERTLKSICSQTDQNFRVIVSCHETPEIGYKNDKIEFHNMEFLPPNLAGLDWEQARQAKEGDKTNKILEGFALAQKYEPSHIMVVDSDDCISHKIVEFVHKDANKTTGWYINKGYYYQEGKPYAFLKKTNFNQFCGSCIIIKNEFAKELILQEPFLYYNHFTMNLPNGKELAPLPFAGAMYSMANGENHFMSVSKAESIAKSASKFWPSLYSKLKRYRPTLITRSFKRNFGFYYIK